MKKTYLSFGHPIITANEGFMKRVSDGVVDIKTRKTIERISQENRLFQTHSRPPRRFKLTIGTDKLIFNDRVKVETKFISEKPIINFVDLTTQFCVPSFIRS